MTSAARQHDERIERARAVSIEAEIARQLATVAIVAGDAVAAWRAFKNWQDQ